MTVNAILCASDTYNSAKTAMEKIRASEFPKDCVVKVDCAQYQGRRI